MEIVETLRHGDERRGDARRPISADVRQSDRELSRLSGRFSRHDEHAGRDEQDRLHQEEDPEEIPEKISDGHSARGEGDLRGLCRGDEHLPAETRLSTLSAHSENRRFRAN